MIDLHLFLLIAAVTSAAVLAGSVVVSLLGVWASSAMSEEEYREYTKGGGRP